MTLNSRFLWQMHVILLCGAMWPQIIGEQLHVLRGEEHAFSFCFLFIRLLLCIVAWIVAVRIMCEGEKMSFK